MAVKEKKGKDDNSEKKRPGDKETFEKHWQCCETLRQIS